MEKKESGMNSRSGVERYNVVWDSPSEDCHGSMPLGNGDIGLNAWIEPSGDLMFYIGKTDSWEDNARLAKELDPSRLATHVSNRWQGPDSRWFEEDIICCNGYPAIWGPADGDQPLDEKLTLSAKTWRDEWLPYIHNAYPNKPVLVTEFGYAAFAGTHDNRYSETWYAEFMKADFPAIAEKDYVCGATVWCWADHAWPPNNLYGFGNAPLSQSVRCAHTQPQTQGAVRGIAENVPGQEGCGESAECDITK